VDQDALGLQAVNVAEPAKGLQVWSKTLARPGTRAVVLLNRTSAAADIMVQWEDLGFEENSTARVTDVWTGAEASAAGSYAAQVPAGDGVMMVIEGREGPSTKYAPENAAKSAAGHPERCPGCVKEFSGVAASRLWALVEIAYRNPGLAMRFAELRVNAQGMTRIAFPKTGAAAGTVTVEVRLDRPGAANVLSFSSETDALPAIESIRVE
jgi:hypothetical protein